MKKILMVALAAAFLSCGTRVRETTQVPNIDAVVALYLYISIARLDVYMCEARREPAREAAFLDAAQQDAHRLREELGAYDENGRVGPYCGSVCQEMINFLAMAGRVGLLPCEE